MTNQVDPSFIPFLLNFRELRVRGVRRVRMYIKGKNHSMPNITTFNTFSRIRGKRGKNMSVGGLIIDILTPLTPTIWWTF